MNLCKQCGIETERPMFCTRNCSGKWRRLNVYGDKFTNKWRSSSPRKFLSSSLNKGLGREGLSLDYVMSLYEAQEGRCALSGKEMTYIAGAGKVPTNISIDQIIPSGGYVEGNIQLVCRQANIIKFDLPDNDALVDWCECIINNLKERNNGY